MAVLRFEEAEGLASRLSRFVTMNVAPRDDECDVILLLPAAELLNCTHNGSEQYLGCQVNMGGREIQEPRLPELFSPVTQCFRDAVRVKHQGVPRFQARLRRGAFPVSKQSEHH